MLNNNLQFLGQSGFRLKIEDLIIYIDPYLTDSLEEKYGNIFKREYEIPISPYNIYDADYVFITHIHQDHCDLDTLLPIYKNSNKCVFISTNEVCNFLNNYGFEKDKLIVANEDIIFLNQSLNVKPIPAAHPNLDLDEIGYYKYLGFLFEINSYKFYHSGDTCLNQKIIDSLLPYIPINTVMLPVNEQNYFRENIQIIGNMGIRDAFNFANLLETKELIPIHWDMFKCNSVYKEELNLLYNLIKPNFKLNIIENSIL